MAGFPDLLADCTGFQWDTGNAEKNWRAHRVALVRAQQVFFCRPAVIAPDLGHPEREARYAALGKTMAGRRLSLVFTIRGTLVRVISARDMGRRDRRLYAAVEAAQ